MTPIKIRVPAELFEVYKRGGTRPGFQFNADALTARRVITLGDFDLAADHGLLRARVPCTAAEVLTFHSVRKEFIPAVPGYTIAMVAAYGHKPAGPAFTIGGGSFIQGRYNNTAKTAAISLPVVNFLDLATKTSFLSQHPATSTATGDEANAADIAGKSLVSGTNGNVDYTGTGSPLTLVFLYRLIPNVV